MTVKRPVPCSVYDIPGMQEWLDEMALQGLFLKEFSIHSDRAVFEQGEPKPVRYRLDPMSKNKEKDQEREEPYAEMGWRFVCQLHKRFSVFSCDDPQAPELYTDPQSLAFALNDLMRREVRNNIILTLFLLFALFAVLIDPHGYLRELILWERPRSLVNYVLYPIFIVLLLPLLILEVKQKLKIRDTLAQGLPLKAGRRRNRPRFLMVYIPTYILIWALPRLLLPDIAWQTYDLNKAETVRPWPTFYQTEAAGPHPLEEEPEVGGYITFNSSYFAPVQEFSSAAWKSLYFDPATGDYLPDSQRDYPLWKGVRYVQARSPKMAELVYRVELADAAKTLDRLAKSKWVTSSSRITGYTGFEPRDWPGVDRLEAARYQQKGLDCWSIAALRGTDILVVRYKGYARWEDCLPLFLEVLDQKEANV